MKVQELIVAGAVTILLVVVGTLMLSGPQQNSAEEAAHQTAARLWPQEAIR